MLRYMAFLWNDRDQHQTAHAERLARRLQATNNWTRVLRCAGAEVYAIGTRSEVSEIHPLHGNAGVVLGTVFRRATNRAGSEAASPTFDEATSFQIVNTGGRALVAACWGNYVAIAHDQLRERTWILRGPASPLPCLRMTYQRVEVVFSLMEDGIALRVQRFSINWDYVTRHLFMQVSSRQTGLLEVSQVLPGECIEVAAGSVSTHEYWRAAAVANSHPIEDATEAATALRETAKECVHAWASIHRRIVLYLSGLDSSIVRACLADAPSQPDIVCVTEYSEDADGDEREYARAVVAVMDCTHVERQRSADVRVEDMFKASRTVTPQVHLRRVESARWEGSFAEQQGVSAIFSGEGGDELFGQGQTHLFVADFIYGCGFPLAAFSVAYDAAQLEGVSIWHILYEAIRDGSPRSHWSPLLEVLKYRTLARAEVIERLRRQAAEDGSQRRSSRSLGPGKRWHSEGVSVVRPYYDPMGRDGDPEHVAPLLSQPLIEVCLRIRSDLMIRNGIDRAIARLAFADELPAKIIRRRSKGGVSFHSQEILRANLAAARDLLLDGLLVQHGLLDRARVVSALSDRPSSTMKGMAEILRCLGTEVWARQWREAGKTTAA